MNADLELALEMADAADVITMRHFRDVDLVVETKADRTPVSNADREVEAMIRERLAVHRPGDAVVGEEQGSSGTSARRWIIDPVDGTRNYVRGIPVFATLLALEVDGEMTVGVASAPALQARWWASRGEGAFNNDRRLAVSRVSALADATVCHAHLDAWRETGRWQHLEIVVSRAYQPRGFGDFWQHMLVAEGVADAALEPVVSLWDVAAVQVIVEEAGGRFTDLNGARTPDGGTAISSNGLVHGELLASLGEPRP